MGLYGQDISYTLLFVGKPGCVLRYMFWDTPRRSEFWVIFQPPPEVGPILWQVPVQVQISLLSRHHFGQRLIKWFQGCKWRWLQQVLYYEQYWAREMWSCLMLMCHFVVSLWIDMDRWCIRYLCCISVFTIARICVADVGRCCFSLSTLMFSGEMRGFCVCVITSTISCKTYILPISLLMICDSKLYKSIT